MPALHGAARVPAGAAASSARHPVQRADLVAVLAHGGTACEDPPGVREGANGKLYLAYLRDPDGNKVCALYRMPRA